MIIYLGLLILSYPNFQPSWVPHPVLSVHFNPARWPSGTLSFLFNSLVILLREHKNYSSSSGFRCLWLDKEVWVVFQKPTATLWGVPSSFSQHLFCWQICLNLCWKFIAVNPHSTSHWLMMKFPPVAKSKICVHLSLDPSKTKGIPLASLCGQECGAVPLPLCWPLAKVKIGEVKYICSLRYLHLYKIDLGYTRYLKCQPT